MNRFNTPLRYPGGKQRLTPFVQEILWANKINGHYVEPYAGGAGVAIKLLLSGQVDQIHLNDSDFSIYAFWYCVLYKTEELCRLISSASLTIKEWKLRKEFLKKCDRRKILELGFSLFYLNRCNRSGVLSAGVIGGLDQTGNFKMDARFDKDELINRIEIISLHKKRVSISNLDAEAYINNYIPKLPSNALIYLDPPYYEKGSALYLNSYKKEDHSRLAKVIQRSIKHKWMLSYDGVDDIVELYEKRRYFLYDLQYTAAKVYKGKEVFIFCDKLKLPTSCTLEHIDINLRDIVNA